MGVNFSRFCADVCYGRPRALKKAVKQIRTFSSSCTRLKWDEETDVVFVGVGDVETNRRCLVKAWSALIIISAECYFFWQKN